MSNRSAKRSEKGSSSIANPVLAGARFVMSHAKHVSVSVAAVARFADALAKRKVGVLWTEEKPKRRNEREILTFIFLLDTLNFCFWPYPYGDKRWTVVHRGKPITGYFALSSALNDWFGKHPLKSDFAYFSRMSWADFKKMVQGGVHLQFLRERWQFLRAVSEVFVREYGGDPEKFVKMAGGDAGALAMAIAKELPSFDDRARYAGKEIWILKRAQILVGDIHGAFLGKGPGAFLNMGWLTVFADYKVPQILETYGILKYSPRLEEKIAEKKLIPAGSSEEVEIRTATILAVEKIRTALRARGKDIPAYRLDWFLWKMSQKEKLRLPHHYTKTIYY